MTFSINNLIVALSYALDFIEIDLLGVSTNHSKRVAYIAASIAKNMDKTDEEVFDIITLALLHDIGRCKNWLSVDDFQKYRSRFDRDHCIEGQKIVDALELRPYEENAILYHHEAYDGSGMFGKKGDEIPEASQIIMLADQVEKRFNLMVANRPYRQDVMEYITTHKGSLFAHKPVEALCEASKSILFWLELMDDNIQKGLRRIMPQMYIETDWKNIRKISSIFSEIIDMKSSFTRDHSSMLAHRVEIMANHYEIPEDEKQQLLIAADLHDIGKLVVSNKILHKTEGLEDEEFVVIKEHPFYTRKCLEEIDEFIHITEWAANHHERLNGKGYPYAKIASELDFNSRLIMCLDIYQALVEERPYRGPLTHEVAMAILDDMASKGDLDKEIIKDMHSVLAVA